MSTNPKKNRTSPSVSTVVLRTCIAGLLLASGAAQAQLIIPGNNGQDGAFEPGSNIEVDLSQAVTGQWDTTNSTGAGVYDPEQWAVIFRYTTVTIPSGVTVTFKNHPSRAPVIWLVQGDVTIAGTVSLNGGQGHSDSGSAVLSEPGPGGFRGGRGDRTGIPGSGGMGPGGGGYPNFSANYGTSDGSTATFYGNEGVFPLIGGSGGAGATNRSTGGGAGGGAILVAAKDTIEVNGLIRANGGKGGPGAPYGNPYGGAGSGGAIRLIADDVIGIGALSVTGGSTNDSTNDADGGGGRIRTEANTITLTAANVHSTGTPATPPRIFREAADGVPTITAMALNGETVPTDPASYPTQDVALVDVDEEDTVTLAITAEFVPAGSTVSARVVRLSGQEEIIAAVFDGGSGDETTWNAEIPVAGGFSTIQVHAVLP